MATRPFDSARIRELAKGVETILGNYERINSEQDYQAFAMGTRAWVKANLNRSYNSLMSYLREQVQYTAKDPDRQMAVYSKKAWPIFELESEISPHWSYEGWLRARRQWKQKMDAALAALPEVGAWLDKLHKDKKRNLKPQYREESEQNVSIDGFNMILHEYDEEDPAHRAFVDDLTNALNAYQRRAKRYLPVMLRRKLPMDVMFGSKSSSGNYGDGRITLHQVAMRSRDQIVYTVAHETGHYFGLDWMSHGARAFWIAAIKQDMKPIKLSELLAKWPPGKFFMTWMLEARESDPVLGMQLGAIFDGHVDMPKAFVDADDWTHEGLARYIAQYGDGELRMMRTPITPYANQNPDEAFAEAIALLVAYGPQAVHKQVRQWLDIVLPGEIKVARIESVRALKTLARYAATIDRSSIERWRKDLRVMTKIYKDLGVDEDSSKWDEARKLFQTFRNNFEEWVYKQLIPKEDRDRSPLEALISKLAWELRYQLDGSMLFPVIRPSNVPDWSRFRNERERNLKRYQAAANKAFKEIDLYLETKLDARVERRNPVEHFEISGIGVVVKNSGRDESYEKEVEAFLRNLKRRVDGIRAAGFGHAVRGLTVTVDFDVPKSEFETSAKYTPSTDTLLIYPLGLVREDGRHGTFSHECGHRFYFKALSPSARQRWEVVMTERGVQIGQTDIDRFVELVKSKIDPERPNALDVEQVIVPMAKDESESAKFRELAGIPVGPIMGGTFDEARYRTGLSGRLGEFAQIEEISDYANSSPIEAFAEVFRIWVDRGPNTVKPWTREFFRETCRHGGAKLAAYDQCKLAALKVAARHQAREVSLADVQALAIEVEVPLNLPADGQPFSWDDNDSLVDELCDDDPLLTPDLLPSVKGAARYHEKFAKYKEIKRVPKATGKGTTEVRVYSPRQIALRKSKKSKRLQKLSGNIDRMMKEIKQDLTSSDTKTARVALAISLINVTFERVGNETSAAGENSDTDKTPHLGVTGWAKKNITFKGGKATIKYRGKSSVDHVKVVEDPATVKALKKAYEGCKSDEDCVFHWADGKITAKEVNDRLKEFGDLTAKDLRGWHANRLMKEELARVRKGKLPTDKKEREKKLKEEWKAALETTAKEIQHEPGTLQGQYLVDAMREAYMKDGTVIDKLDE